LQTNSTIITTKVRECCSGPDVAHPPQPQWSVADPVEEDEELYLNVAQINARWITFEIIIAPKGLRPMMFPLGNSWRKPIEKGEDRTTKGARQKTKTNNFLPF